VAREDNILQGINGGSGPPWESGEPLHIRTGPLGRVQDLRGYRPDPRDGSWTSLCGVQATLSMVPGFWDKEYPGLNQGRAGVRSRHVSGPYRVRYCSPLRRSPDAATWPTARDVSRRVEPDVRPLGRAAAAFIADKVRRLPILLAGDAPPQHLMSPTTPLAGDVPPRHLMCPVHSTNGSDQAILQVACLSNPLADSTPVPRHTLCSSWLARYRGSSREILILYGLRTLWRLEIF
jgi:hypothetical protein